MKTNKCRICLWPLKADHHAAAYCNTCKPVIKRIHKKCTQSLRNAINAGKMKESFEHDCVDCGDVATGYDHRDYGKPLQVEPVCAKCNARRGPAIKFGWRALAVRKRKLIARNAGLAPKKPRKPRAAK